MTSSVSHYHVKLLRVTPPVCATVCGYVRLYDCVWLCATKCMAVWLRDYVWLCDCVRLCVVTVCDYVWLCDCVRLCVVV